MQNRRSQPGREITHEVDEEGLPPAPKKLLLLDDDQAFVDTLRSYLEGEGYQVALAANGVEGLKFVMADRFDAIICDMAMTAMPGDMFYKAVERVKPALTKRFVFITGHQGNPEIDAFIRSIHGLMLWKPFELYQLNEAVTMVIQKAERG